MKQTFIDFECLLIDDGSTDNSSIICNEYTCKDSRIKYFHQNNFGPAMARYNGVDKAESNMVMFIDSDDWVEPMAVEVFYTEYEKSKADIIVNTAYNFILDGVLHRKYAKPIDINAQSPLVYYLIADGVKSNWNKLMSKKLWENIYIPEKSNFEDFVTGVQIFSKVKKIICIKIPVYNQMCDTRINTLSYINYSSDYNKPLETISQLAIFNWIKGYISVLQNDNDENTLDAAFSRFFMQFIGLPYLIASKHVTRKEAVLSWEHYERSMSILRYPLHHKILINAYYFSLILGRIFQFLYHYLHHIYLRLCRLFQ